MRSVSGGVCEWRQVIPQTTNQEFHENLFTVIIFSTTSSEWEGGGKRATPFKHPPRYLFIFLYFLFAFIHPKPTKP